MIPPPPPVSFQSDPLIDAPRAECDRSAPIQETFSSFTQSYSIMIGGMEGLGGQDGALTGREA